MSIIKLAFRNIYSAGVRTWLNVIVLSVAFVSLIWLQGMVGGMFGQMKIATIDSELVALDAASGRPVSEFGEDGVLDLMNGVRGDISPVGRIGSSSPPVIVGDVVVVGSAQEVGPGLFLALHQIDTHAPELVSLRSSTGIQDGVSAS